MLFYWSTARHSRRIGPGFAIMCSVTIRQEICTVQSTISDQDLTVALVQLKLERRPCDPL
jgi:hypothetical protein